MDRGVAGNSRHLDGSSVGGVSLSWHLLPQRTSLRFLAVLSPLEGRAFERLWRWVPGRPWRYRQRLTLPVVLRAPPLPALLGVVERPRHRVRLFVVDVVPEVLIRHLPLQPLLLLVGSHHVFEALASGAAVALHSLSQGLVLVIRLSWLCRLGLGASWSEVVAIPWATAADSGCAELTVELVDLLPPSGPPALQGLRVRRSWWPLWGPASLVWT